MVPDPRPRPLPVPRRARLSCDEPVRGEARRGVAPPLRAAVGDTRVEAGRTAGLRRLLAPAPRLAARRRPGGHPSDTHRTPIGHPSDTRCPGTRTSDEHLCSTPLHHTAVETDTCSAGLSGTRLVRSTRHTRDSFSRRAASLMRPPPYGRARRRGRRGGRAAARMRTPLRARAAALRSGRVWRTRPSSQQPGIMHVADSSTGVRSGEGGRREEREDRNSGRCN